MPLELKVNGINCGGCKSSLVTALVGVDGVDEACLDIATKAETGEHPNKVVINAEVDAEKVKAAIATYAHAPLSSGRARASNTRLLQSAWLLTRLSCSRRIAGSTPAVASSRLLIRSQMNGHRCAPRSAGGRPMRAPGRGQARGAAGEGPHTLYCREMPRGVFLQTYS